MSKLNITLDEWIEEMNLANRTPIEVEGSFTAQEFAKKINRQDCTARNMIRKAIKEGTIKQVGERQFPGPTGKTTYAPLYVACRKAKP